MNPFERLHPFVILIYYAVAVILMFVIRHPFLILMAWGISLLHYICFAGFEKGIRLAGTSMGAALLCLLVNPLLNHRGVTLLFMLGEWRITMESVLYGGYMALVLFASLVLFACFSFYMNAKNIMTLMAGRFPSFSLLFSMILRFIPKAGRDFREMTSLHGNRPAVWSALIGLSLEDAVGRSLSMKSRYYGSTGRSSYYQKSMRLSDVLLCGMALLTVALAAGFYYTGRIRVRFFPLIHIEGLPVLLWVLFFFYYSVPLIWQGKEELLWVLSRRRITGSHIRTKDTRQWISGSGR